MDVKKIMALLFLMLHIGALATTTTTTTNAFLDAQNAQKNNEIYNQNERRNREANDDPVLVNLGEIMSTAANGASLYNLAGAVKGVNSSSVKPENDTGTNPGTWRQIKLKPWEIILVAIFIARELREVGKSGGGNSAVNNAEFESSPIGQIKNTNDIRTRIVMNLFKVTGNITDNVGRGLSNILAIFLLLIGTLEVLIGILKGVTNPNNEEQKTILMVVKDIFPQIAVIGITISILANGFFWNFYTGPLFNLAMRIGGMLSGKSFNMYDMPDYLTKLFNVPFKVMLSAVKMLFSVKGIMNNINPMLILLAGLVVLWMCLKAAIEIMTVLIDYLLIGCFAMVTMVFVVLGITKNAGFGAIGGVIAAIVNIIVMFALIGYTFQVIDRLDGEGSTDISKLLGIIVGVFVVYGLLKQIKTIGSYLNSGSAAFIQGSSITTEVIEGGFNMMIAAKAVGNKMKPKTGAKSDSKLSGKTGEKTGGNTGGKTGGDTGGKRSLNDILDAAKKNVGDKLSGEGTGNKKGDISSLEDSKEKAKRFATGDGDKDLDAWIKNKMQSDKEKEKEKEDKKNEKENAQKMGNIKGGNAIEVKKNNEGNES